MMAQRLGFVGREYFIGGAIWSMGSASFEIEDNCHSKLAVAVSA
jgi:hypothetical protein